MRFDLSLPSPTALILPLFFVLSSVCQLSAMDASEDGKIKTWLTAELLGAMRWAKAESETTKRKLDFTAAEMVCRKRLQAQIDAGKIKKGMAFLIAENARKKGVYRREPLTLERAEELRKLIISVRIP